MSLWDALKDPGAKRVIRGVLVSEVHRVDEVSKERKDLRGQGAIEVISNNDTGLYDFEVTYAFIKKIMNSSLSF